MPAYRKDTDPAVMREFASALLPTLTARQQEIYKLRALEWTNGRIATFLRVCLSTIEKEVSVIRLAVQGAMRRAQEDARYEQQLDERQIKMGHTLVVGGDPRFKKDKVAINANDLFRATGARRRRALEKAAAGS